MIDLPTPDSESRPPVAEFVTTHWSVVLAAGQKDLPQAAGALEKLCRTYWYPLYAYVRRRGSDAATAEDLTQEFFERLLAKDFPAGIRPEGGKFRSYLLTALKHFLVNEWQSRQTRKRGGDANIFSFDGLSAEARYALEPADPATPETLYERRWAATLLEQVRRRLRDEHIADGKEELFERLQPCLTGTERLIAYNEIAAQLNTTESAVKMAVHRLRKRYGELLREEIAQTVATPAEVAEEIRCLIAATAA